MEDILKENWTVNNILNAVDSEASASESDESDVEQTADDILNNISQLFIWLLPKPAVTFVVLLILTDSCFRILVVKRLEAVACDK